MASKVQSGPASRLDLLILIIHCICVVVSCSAQIGISAPATALLHCTYFGNVVTSYTAVNIPSPFFTSHHQVLNEGNHLIDGKSVEAKRATKQKKVKPKKVFVGGVPNETTDEDMETHFSQYGEVS